jgi:crotonobetainyl-CoA:carnitine CoA-transferase CaiB-like acyl-CoA transferase
MTPLKGRQVVDLSKGLAGPPCGQYLGELGAGVVKLEPVGEGDDARSWPPRQQGESATFLAVNHNKRSIALDLKCAEGRDIVHKMVAAADVVLQGFGGGTAKKLGVDYATLRTLNPRTTDCEISGYGRSGPMGTEPGYGVMRQAFERNDQHHGRTRRGVFASQLLSGGLGRRHECRSRRVGRCHRTRQNGSGRLRRRPATGHRNGV